MAETKARRRIRKAIESRGFTLESLDYEAPYDAGEMMGYGGGWYGSTVEQIWPNTMPGNEFGGLNVEDALADIDWSMTPPEPCACDRPPMFNPRGGVKGWPSQVAMHDAECRWFIRYRLTWWREHGPDWSAWESAEDLPSCVCGYNGTPEECAASRGAGR